MSFSELQITTKQEELAANAFSAMIRHAARQMKHSPDFALERYAKDLEIHSSKLRTWLKQGVDREFAQLVLEANNRLSPTKYAIHQLVPTRRIACQWLAFEAHRTENGLAA